MLGVCVQIESASLFRFQM